MTPLAHIAAVGARTPVGLQVAPAAAAVRAGISGLADHPFMVDQVGDNMQGALDAEIDPTVFGAERLLLLAEPALREASETLARATVSIPGLPLCLALPEARPGFSDCDVNHLLVGLAKIKGLPVPLAATSFFLQGHAAGFQALAHITEQIQQGKFEACWLGGVESYFHPDTMEWLDANRQLMGSVSRSGFVPGEGAGFCLIASQRAIEKWNLPSLARVRSVATGQETKRIKTDDLCFGEGLTATVQKALSGLNLPSERINSITCDINGERYRGEEWGFVCLRLSHYFNDPTAYLSPAEIWGDMGAASAPLYIMLACQGAARGYSKGPRTMIWASSENGLRAAAVIETTETRSAEARMS